MMRLLLSERLLLSQQQQEQQEQEPDDPDPPLPLHTTQQEQDRPRQDVQKQGVPVVGGGEGGGQETDPVVLAAATATAITTTCGTRKQRRTTRRSTCTSTRLLGGLMIFVAIFFVSSVCNSSSSSSGTIHAAAWLPTPSSTIPIIPSSSLLVPSRTFTTTFTTTSTRRHGKDFLTPRRPFSPLARMIKDPNRIDNVELDSTETPGAVQTTGSIRNDSSSSTTSSLASMEDSSNNEKKEYRTIRRMERNARLPVWPVLNGVVLWFLGLLLGRETASHFEHVLTGRVCPNFFNYQPETSPFIMLVHHCHSFAPIFFDPVRWIQRSLILPEGFPAHPHRGFITVTYFLHGGFTHRDSMGVFQSYGASSSTTTTPSSSSSSTTPAPTRKHTQWLMTGAGILHEEMFDHNNYDSSNNKNPLAKWFLPVRQELYQLWLNVPSKYKMTSPSSVLLGGPDETPVLVSTTTTNDGQPTVASQTLVLAGTYTAPDDASSSSATVTTATAAAPILSDLVIFHVHIAAGATWRYNIPDSYDTALLYLRTGTLSCPSAVAATTSNTSDGKDLTRIPVHHVAYFADRPKRSSSSKTGWTTTIELKAIEGRDADFLFLAGEKIQEPCAAQGSMVMTTDNEINQAYADYQAGYFGRPWDHKLSSEEWKDHVSKYPSKY